MLIVAVFNMKGGTGESALVEVPVLISLVNMVLYFQKRYFTVEYCRITGT